MESVVASLSASECLGYLQGASLDANALAQLRAVLGDAARQDPSLRARLEALAPAASPPPASPPPPAAAADGGDLAAFLATAGLERFAPPLPPSRASPALLAAPGDALKDLRDPETGARALAVGPLSKLRGALKDRRASPVPPARAPLEIDRVAAGLAACGVASVADVRRLGPDGLKDLRDAATGARVLAVGPLSKLRSFLAEPAPPAGDGGLGAFLAAADLAKYEAPLARAGFATLGALRGAAPETLKDLRDPQTGAKVLAIGPLSRLRTALGASPTPRAAPAAQDAPLPAGLVFGCASGDAADESLDRRVFAFPASHLAVVRAVKRAPDASRRAVRCFLYDAARRRLHGIFRPDCAADDPDAVAPYAFTAKPWTGVALPPPPGARPTPYAAQLKVAPVQPFPAISTSRLPPGLLSFDGSGAPAYALDADQVREIAKLFVKNRTA
ncbi:hypothetical protein SO694_00019043 [Aureococcus anophagefferens]|uniref:DCD domain-containing protein n=1 Tax=Aureococcus anophagefferens TaxID=44056 RepID=A0ABR1FZU1_AURAN